MENLSFIEKQFPVSKMSKESYKERKSSQGQTITGLGKWWGRKPLVLVRAAILGCLLPATDNPKKDMDIFLKIMSMDSAGLLQRKAKKFTIKGLYEKLQEHADLFNQYRDWFIVDGSKVKLQKNAPRDAMEAALFNTFGYDEKLAMCMRPEQLAELHPDTWRDINSYLGTSAENLAELVEQLSEKRYGHKVVVGDCFCGGGSIPFEAARIGCDTYASDLNPVAGLLTWADLNICGASDEVRQEIEAFQKKAYDAVDKEICALGIEQNERGDRALSYLYCLETICPECGHKVPLLPSFVVGIRAGKVVAVLKEREHDFAIDIVSDVDDDALKYAREHGTVQDSALVCPHCGKGTPISALRHDRVDEDGNTVYGLRLWEKNEFQPRPDDVFQERLYAVRYEHREINDAGKLIKRERYYCAPSQRDFENEVKVKKLVTDNFQKWQVDGVVPSGQIEDGEKTREVIINRGWKYWHQLFNARQLLVLSRLAEQIKHAKTTAEKVAGILGLNKCVNYDSRLCRIDPSRDMMAQVFYNQALNTLYNYGIRGNSLLGDPWFGIINTVKLNGATEVKLQDARDTTNVVDIWVTDPPYADAINYHELTEFFLAWDKGLIQGVFPAWYTDSKRILAVRGDEDFSQTMIEIYSNLTKHMSDNGVQIVMFTHSDPAIWAQLAIIMWKSKLKVTAAWNVTTETASPGMKNGNYVTGTVLLVLRKQNDNQMAFLDEINGDIREEVKQQIATMQELDDKEEPNFSDPDYVLAAYAASLKALTAYALIEDLDLDYELGQAIQNPTESQIVSVIENAKKIAYDSVIPLSFDNYLWRELSNAEKFYIKGLESEKAGSYELGTYQEYARGFNIGGYSQLMASERANMARLKTPYEMAGRSLNDVPDFENSLLRVIFAGIYAGIKEDMNPTKALGYIKNERSDYWDKREMIKQMLVFFLDIKNISNMQPHWTKSAEMAEQLFALVTHDSI